MTSTAPIHTTWSARWLLLAVPLGLLPLVLWHTHLRQLFWFGDEWDLLDQISNQGFLPWCQTAFAENFVPLFKLLWGGLVLLGNGHYGIMIYALWVTHVLVVLVFGATLRSVGLGLFGTTLSMALFGLTACNLETLAWSVQWSAILSTLFCILGLFFLASRPEPAAPLGGKERLVLLFVGLASALCFARGVLTGPVLVVFMLIQPWSTLKTRWTARLIDFGACLLPSIVVAVIISLQSSGNHHATLTAESLISMVRFGGLYFSANPFWRLLNFDLLLSSSLMVLPVALKLAVIWTGFRLASQDTCRLLASLLVFDLGNAVLLGLGRHHTGLDASLSLRYQYASLICTLPFLCVVLQAATDQLSKRYGLTIRLALVVALCAMALWQWPAHARWFAGWRGSAASAALISRSQTLSEYAVPGIPYMPTSRGLELIQEFDLH